MNKCGFPIEIKTKIRYLNILTVDGQEPNELAAVYGLGPKTARFKRRKSE